MQLLKDYQFLLFLIFLGVPLLLFIEHLIVLYRIRNIVRIYSSFEK